MWNDPIVEEVRRTRLGIEKECKDDFALIYARAVEIQKKSGAKLISRSSSPHRTQETNRDAAIPPEKRVEDR